MPKLDSVPDSIPTPVFVSFLNSDNLAPDVTEVGRKIAAASLKGLGKERKETPKGIRLSALQAIMMKGGFKKKPNIKEQLELKQNLTNKLTELKKLIKSLDCLLDDVWAAREFHCDTCLNTQHLRTDEDIIAKTNETELHIIKVEKLVLKDKLETLINNCNEISQIFSNSQTCVLTRAICFFKNLDLKIENIKSLLEIHITSLKNIESFYINKKKNQNANHLHF